MNLALNNAVNVTQYYQQVGEDVKIEVVTFGPGLHMLRDDTSPVKVRIETIALSAPEISFKACGKPPENMQKAENKDIPIIPWAQVVKSGVVHIMQLAERGWTYAGREGPEGRHLGVNRDPGVLAAPSIDAFRGLRQARWQGRTTFPGGPPCSALRTTYS